MIVSGEVLAALALLFLAYWFYFKNNAQNNILNNIPLPAGLPIIGNAHQINKSTYILQALKKFDNECGKFFRLKVGPFEQMLIVTDYKMLEFILTSQSLLDKSKNYRFLNNWLGNGLLISTGAKWQKHRKIITPTFHFKILEDFVQVFEDCGRKLVEKMRNYDGNENADIYPLVTLCTLDIICETAMGTSINAQDNDSSEFVCSVKEMCRIVLERSVSVLQAFEFLYPLTADYYKEKKALNILHSHTDSVIKKRRQQLKESAKDGAGVQEKDDVGLKQKKMFLDMLLEASMDGRPLTDAEIRAEVDTFMFEGHDTTASAISFALYNLANHPQVQQKAWEEQREIFGKEKNPQVTISQLQNMKYLEKVIKETLRLYPSVPFIGRTLKDVVKYDDKLLPPHVIIILNIYGIQRDPHYYKDPDAFNPSRFDEIDGKLPFSYIPFSAGPRNCVGQKFAMLEMKSTISKVVRNFELSAASPKHELVLAPELVLKSSNGIKMGIKIRK